MKLPPYLFDMRVAEAGKRGFRIWLPVFLLWPFGLVILLVAFAVTVLVDGVLSLVGQSYHRYTLLLWGCLALLGETRGLTVRVHGDNATVDVAVR
jgi:hypothetical protein